MEKKEREKILQAVKGNKLNVQIKHSRFKHYAQILASKEARELYNDLPREHKPTELDTTQGNNSYSDVEADLVICALGFKGNGSNPLVQETIGLNNVLIAGDAAGSQPWIIVGAQKSASDTYQGKIHTGDMREVYFTNRVLRGV